MVALGHHVHAQDLLEPVLLPKPPEPDHLEPAPEEEDTDTEVKSTPEESDDEVVTEKVKYNSPEPGPPIAGINPSGNLKIQNEHKRKRTISARSAPNPATKVQGNSEAPVDVAPDEEEAPAGQ